MMPEEVKNMTLDEIEKYFGGFAEACRAVGVTPQAQTTWKRQGYISWARQWKFEQITNGVLKKDEEDPRRWVKGKPKSVE